MDEHFRHGYALLIGVTDSTVRSLALPTVGRDVEAVRRVLTHPQRCAYPTENVKFLMSQEASRAGILEGLEWLQECIRADAGGNATAIVYFSGHGWRDESANPPQFYLIPYDVRADRIRSSALRAQDLDESVQALQPPRLMVVLDCCHAGGMDAKELPMAPSGFVATAIDPDLLMGAGGPFPSGGKGLPALAEGAGRAVLSSSKGDQQSYIRRDGSMSIFTYHLIEALTGHAQPQQGATEVLVSDVMSHVSRHVPQTALAEAGARQEPDYRVSGNFPIALLLGGKGLPEGQPAPDPMSLSEGSGTRGPSVTIHSGGGDITAGTKVVGRIGNVGPGGQAAIGTNVSQQILRVPLEWPAADRRTLDSLLQNLESNLAELDLSAGQRDDAAYNLEQVREALTRLDRTPDLRQLRAAVDWLAHYVPGLLGGLNDLFASPIVRQVILAGGERSAEWLRERFAGGAHDQR